MRGRRDAVQAPVCFVCQDDLERDAICEEEPQHKSLFFLVACTQLYDLLCPSVVRSVTLSFFSPFYVILSHFRSFYILTLSFSLDDRTRLRGVGLIKSPLTPPLAGLEQNLNQELGRSLGRGRKLLATTTENELRKKE